MKKEIYFDAYNECVNMHQILRDFYLHGYDAGYLRTERGFELIVKDGRKQISKEFDWFDLRHIRMSQKDFMASVVTQMIEILKEAEWKTGLSVG